MTQQHNTHGHFQSHTKTKAKCVNINKILKIWCVSVLPFCHRLYFVDNNSTPKKKSCVLVPCSVLPVPFEVSLFWGVWSVS